MNREEKGCLEATLFIIIIVICIIISCVQSSSHKKEILDWANKYGYRVQKCESQFFDTGPYWHKKGADYWRLDVLDGHEEHHTFYWEFSYSTSVEEYETRN